MSPPLLFVPDAPPMPVAPPHVHELTQPARVNELPGFPDGRMVAVVESDPDQRTAAIRRLDEGIKLYGAAGARFLHEHMFPGPNRRQRDVSQEIVGGGDDDAVHI